MNQTMQAQERGAVGERSPHVPHAKGAHKLEVVRYPGRRHYSFITHRKLKGLLPYQNTIYLLESCKGIITSIEALKDKIGGIPLLIIYL